MVASEVPGTKRIHTVLFTGRGEMDDEVKRAADAGTVLLFTAEDVR